MFLNRNIQKSILVAEELYSAAERKFGHQFCTVDELVAELLRELLREDAQQMDEGEQRVIEERLKSLGYI